MATMIRWNPMREMMAMQNVLDRLMDDRRAALRTSEASYTLALDVYEKADAYTIVAALPGVGADHIEIRWHDDVLTIAAELPTLTPTGDEVRTHMQERPTGKIARSLRLSKAINTEAVEALYQDGVLTLTLPKSAEAQPKLIPVRTTISAN